MPFRNGAVTYARFALTASPPVRPDAAFLGALEESGFTPGQLTSSSEPRAGWTAGRHILDMEFDPAEIVFERTAHAAMRMDQVRVPPEVKRAYLALAEREALRASERAGRPFLSRSAKSEARDEATRRWDAEVADGRFRSSKLVPVLFDLARATVLAPATTDVVSSALRDLIASSLNCRLEPRSAGGLAFDLAERRGGTNDLEDCLPQPFSAAPAETEHAEVSAQPSAPWAQAGPEPKDFLGNVFLLWLWWHVERAEGLIRTAEGVDVEIAIDRVVEMECAWGVTGRQTLTGDAPSRRPEAAKALQSGKWPRRLGLLVSAHGEPYEFTLQGDRLVVSALKVPKPVDPPETPRGLIEHRLEFIETFDRLLVSLYDTFLRERLSSAWDARRTAITEWIATRGRPGGASIEFIDRGATLERRDAGEPAATATS